jgi:hypothetical protein
MRLKKMAQRGASHFVLFTQKKKKKKKNVIPLHAMEEHGGERRYSSYSFLTSALDGGEWSASRPLFTKYYDQLTKDEMVGAYSMHGEINAYKILVRKRGRKRSLGRRTCRWKDNIKVDRTGTGWGYGINSSEDDCLLGCCAVYSGRSLPTLQRCLLH